MSKHIIRIKLNGSIKTLTVFSNVTLLDVLLQNNAAQSMQKGCKGGRCGACTVIMEGKVVPSCMVFVVQADGKNILTAEGVMAKESIKPVVNAIQSYSCRFCMPWLVLTSWELLNRSKLPSDECICSVFSETPCNCGNHLKIASVVLKAAGELRTKEEQVKVKRKYQRKLPYERNNISV